MWDLQIADEVFSCELRADIRCTCAAVSPDGLGLATGGMEIEI
jgi:hypothetical protein